MKVLCCGDRNWRNWKLIQKVLASLPKGTIIVEGEARGADKLCRYVAERLGFEVRKYPADWKKYGKAAGPIRNRLQFNTEQPDLVIAFHNDLANSKGTKDMVEYAKSRGCPVTEIREEETETQGDDHGKGNTQGNT